jgi:UDP-3-O-[3-hydroxymyristoyl] glucosamine N-acyltransferase
LSSSASRWNGTIRLRPVAPRDLVLECGGLLRGAFDDSLSRFSPLAKAEKCHLTVLLASRFVRDARAAVERGALVLADEALANAPAFRELPLWSHPHASWAMADILTRFVDVPDLPVTLGIGSAIGPNVVFGPRVVVGARVRIDASCVIGRPGFGWASGPGGSIRPVPQLGGVVIEDDVSIGPLCTVDAGTLAPTILRRGAKLDAQVHVAHNCVVGEGTMVAAQSGFAGSVTLGANVLVGGQVGIADHVTVGDRARIAAKSGVIGDVSAGATVAGYPAVSRETWLRALAWLYRAARRASNGDSQELP